jgi:hypothetical protein
LALGFVHAGSFVGTAHSLLPLLFPRSLKHPEPLGLFSNGVSFEIAASILGFARDGFGIVLAKEDRTAFLALAAAFALLLCFPLFLQYGIEADIAHLSLLHLDGGPSGGLDGRFGKEKAGFTYGGVGFASLFPSCERRFEISGSDELFQ